MTEATTHSIKLVTTEGKVVKGFYNTDNKKNELIFATPVFGETIHNLQEGKIKKPQNLIAAFLAKSAETGEKYKTVTVGRRTVEVQYPDHDAIFEAEHETFYILNGHYLNGEQLIEVATPNGNIKVPVKDFGFQRIVVPKEFKYTKNPAINEILKQAFAEYDIDRKKAKMVSDNLNTIVDMLEKREYIHLCKRTFDIYYGEVTPNKEKSFVKIKKFEI